MLKKSKLTLDEIDLDYSSDNFSASFLPSNSNIHAYPAKLVPNLVHDIIVNLKKHDKINNVLDPFVGSGTVGLESKYLGLNFYGSDLNPLSILISKTKMLTIENTSYIIKNLESFTASLEEKYKDSHRTPTPCVYFNNIEYWFKSKNIDELSFLKNCLNNFLKNKSKKYKEIYSLILLTSFSSTIRKCSLTRNNEFKLYRMVKSDIEKFNPNSFEIFSKSVKQLLNMLSHSNQIFKQNTITSLSLQNAKRMNSIEDNSIDLVFTSPPYGDSKTTVAYGQFSRLPLQWIGDLMKKYLKIEVYTDNCDEYLLGGKKSKIDPKNNKALEKSQTLRNLQKEIMSIINQEVESLNTSKKQLIDISNKINNGLFHLEELRYDAVVFELVKERLRLQILRKINNKAKYTKKHAQTIASEEVSRFFDTNFKNSRSHYRKVKIIESVVPFLKETVERKIKAIPKRANEIMEFFFDLYMVVIETDKKLKEHGQQVWVVGHRTVLGKINVNMRDVLKEWFISMGYMEVKSLQRKYSFKRMPHHINSTITRNEKIATMMEEHILIVKKL